jgi:hypothetical protein
MNWLGMKDSNFRITESKSVALPLGESPLFGGTGRNRTYVVSYVTDLQSAVIAN